MSNQDSISNMITSIYNSQIANKLSVKIYVSKIKLKILEILRNEGYIESFFINKKNKVNILLKYYNNKPVIESIKRVSKPSLRVYKKKNEIPIIMNGLGISIISTSKGIMTDKLAKKLGFGGEIICNVY